MQKFILVTVIIILVSVLALLTVFYLDKDGAKQVLETIGDTQTSLISKFQSSKDGSTINNLIRISDEGASTYTVTPGGKELVYFDRNGVFKIVDFVGNFSFKGENPFAENVAEGVWAKNKLEGIVTTIESDGIRKLLYDYLNGRTSVLNNSIQNVDYSPDGERIVYSFFDKETYEGNISIARSDGTGFVNIFKTRLPDIDLDWVKDDLITFYKKTSGDDLVSLFKIDNKGEGFENILNSKAGLRVLWAPDGKSMVYSIRVNDSYGLHYREYESGVDAKLNLSVSAEKCVWSKSNIHVICFEEETFYKVNVVDGSKDKIYSLADGVKAYDLRLSPQEDYLFFISTKDGQLYSLSI
ncbi:MAG: hypothetical protein R3206_05595 [Salegentibacter mishustinae]|nr:hypothetical protein [Salegentibacter mishustinae]